ncbi:hypothetical protein ACGTN9_18920 [Halobacillus sp. MO56]
MARNLITVKRAKEDIKRLQNYIDLVESYKADTTEKWIIKEYAITNSINKVCDRAKEDNIILEGVPLTRETITAVIKSKPIDRLHRTLQAGYKKKIKHTLKTW